LEKRRLTFREFAEMAIRIGVQPNTLRVWRQREVIPARWALKFYEDFGAPFEILGHDERVNHNGTWYNSPNV
jgi:hypothetical protein